MFSQYPYEGHQNPVIHWDNNDVVVKATPSAVEINGNFSYFSDEVIPLEPEERLVVANFMCGLSEAMTQQKLKKHVAEGVAAIGLVERAYMEFGVARDQVRRSRGPERLVARAHLFRTLDADSYSLPMPEDWQQPFRDLVLMLGSGLNTEQLSKLFKFTNAENQLAMAASRAAESLGLAHLERGGSALVALAANLLPDSDEDEAVEDRIRSPLTDEERSLFETLPRRGGPPLLPEPSTKTHAPGFTSMSSITPQPATPSMMLRPPAPALGLAARAADPASQPAITRSWVVRPHEKIENFRNQTLWLRFEGGDDDGKNLNSRLGMLRLLGIQHAVVQVGSGEAPGHIRGPLTHAEVAVYCARVLGLDVRGVEATIGVSRKRQAQLISIAHSKIGLRISDPELSARVLSRGSFDTSLLAAFEEPWLLRTLKPPTFDGLEREQELLMEFGPHLTGGGTRRDVEYGVLTGREDRGYSRKSASISAVGQDMNTLRASLNLNTLGLKMLYLVYKDYQKQLAERDKPTRQTEEN